MLFRKYLVGMKKKNKNKKCLWFPLRYQLFSLRLILSFFSPNVLKFSSKKLKVCARVEYFYPTLEEMCLEPLDAAILNSAASS